MRHHQPQDHSADAALLDILTAPTPPSKTAFARRDAALDPLLIAAAAASGPHVTRNHYHHDFFPGVMMPSAQGSYDWTKWTGSDPSNRHDRKRLTYVSRQAPRRQRLAISSEKPEGKENDLPAAEPLRSADNVPSAPKKRRPSVISPPTVNPHSDSKSKSRTASVSDTTSSPDPVHVKCMARTRIPTPHGPAFLHLYHNNRDNKEHLAIVIDSAQFSDTPSPVSIPPIRSASLDAVWSENETEMDRITRGAYVGRLSASVQRASDPSTSRTTPSKPSFVAVPPPLIRIHSECFTGETVGSMRCDCGEQLDEAIRQISLPITIPSSMPDTSPVTIPGRGAVIYLRQEGRGIGLLSKIRAYNLQDMGHDTVTANLMLGHKADERGYEIAGAILRDLGLGGEDGRSEGVRVLTNNPDKVEALQKEGVRVMERVAMIPRSWQMRQRKTTVKSVTQEASVVEAGEEDEQVAGATLIGGKAVYGEDLDKYLRTKVLRMGHMLPLWMDDGDAVY